MDKVPVENPVGQPRLVGVCVCVCVCGNMNVSTLQKSLCLQKL